MKRYRVMVKGENFLVQMDGRGGKWGFFTTRIVTAKDPVEAESKAVESITFELQEWVLNDRSDSPILYVVECEETVWWKNVRAGKGFSWFPENPPEAET